MTVREVLVVSVSFFTLPAGDSSSALVKPYRFRMSEIEGFRYRVTVSLMCVCVCMCVCVSVLSLGCPKSSDQGSQ